MTSEFRLRTQSERNSPSGSLFESSWAIRLFRRIGIHFATVRMRIDRRAAVHKGIVQPVLANADAGRRGNFFDYFIHGFLIVDFAQKEFINNPLSNMALEVINELTIQILPVLFDHFVDADRSALLERRAGRRRNNNGFDFSDHFLGFFNGARASKSARTRKRSSSRRRSSKAWDVSTSFNPAVQRSR